MQGQLFLYEELVLLALRDKKGTLEADETRFVYTVAGSLLAELLLLKRVAVDEVRRDKKLVNIESTEPVGDPLLDECMVKLTSAKRRASLKTWVSRFVSIKKLKHRVALQLCRRGILRADEATVLLVFTRKIYPELDPRPERELVGRLRQAIFTDTTDLDPRTIVLISLAHRADVLKNVFDKKELKRRKDRIDQICEGEMTGAAAQEVYEAMEAVMFASVMMPALTSTTTSV
ncbi:MAG: GPP34 family phosphoprotein [Gemmatimonadota bacterium]|nr:MAG: GPP34 family phosphoprotein [Gemmatimonadota bacterium]